MSKDVLAIPGKGYDWEQIPYEFDQRLAIEAIAEATPLASRVPLEKTEKRRSAA